MREPIGYRAADWLDQRAMHLARENVTLTQRAVAAEAQYRLLVEATQSPGMTIDGLRRVIAALENGRG